MKKGSPQKGNQITFYSRNPSKLKEDIKNVRDSGRITQIVLDYEFKKSIDYGQLSQNLGNFKQFVNVQNLFLNFGQCALNTQKILLLLRGFSPIVSKLKQVYMIFENCTTLNEDTVEALNKFIQECGSNLNTLSLNLKKCGIGNQGIQMLLNQIQTTDVRVLSLNLESNDLQYDSELGKSLTMVFDKQKSLKMVEIILAHNDIQDSGAQDLAQSLSNLKQSTCLLINLVGCQITDYGIECLSKNIQTLSQLQNLYLCFDWNKINKEGSIHLANCISKLSNLVSLNLDLDYNIIGHEGVQAIAESLLNCTQLQNLHMNLAHNDLGDDGLRSLGEGLPNFSHLKNLQFELGWNKLTGESVKVLASKLERYKTLQSLNIFIDNNKIEDVGLSSISNCLLQLNNLMRLQLDLDDNDIGQESLKAIITSLTGIPLKSLMINLVNNQIEQETINIMAKFLKNNFPNIDTSNFSLKSGSDRVLPMLNSKVLQSSGISLCIMRFCEIAREKAVSSSFLEISQREFYSVMEELMKKDIIELIFDISVSEQSSLEFIQGIEGQQDPQNQQQNFNAETGLLDELVSFDVQGQRQITSRSGSRGQLARPIKKSPDRVVQQQQQFQQQSQKGYIRSDKKSPPRPQQLQNQEQTRQPQQQFFQEPNSYEAVYYDLKQENMMLRKENNDLKRRLGQRFEPDVIVPLEKYSNLDCKILPFTLNEFVQEIKLGMGTFGEVWLVSRGSQKFAQKTLEFDLKQRTNYVKDLKDFFFHINDIVRSIRHENILYIYGLAFDVSDSGCLRTHVIMELMHCDLRQYVKENLNRNTDLNLKIMKNVLEALVYFNKNKILHSALKPSNILIDSKYKAKISDVGISKIVKIQLHVEGESTSVYGFAPKFSAPEIFDGREDESTDIWSFGCLLFYIFTGESPWAGLSEYQQLTVMLKRTSVIQHFKSTPVGQQIQINQAIESIIEKCTRYDGRPTAEEILQIFPTNLESNYQKPSSPQKPQKFIQANDQIKPPEVNYSESNQKSQKEKISQSQYSGSNQQQQPNQSQFQEYDPNEPTKTAQKY